MTEIPDPPARPVCSACGPLLWLYSPRTSRWVAFVPAPTGGPHAITPHPCRNPTDPHTWRTTRPAAPPSPEYLAAKAALTGDPTNRAKEASAS